MLQAWFLGAGRAMQPDTAIQMMGNLFFTGLLICAPVLGLTLLIGILISVLQVITQVQEASLTFIPKILAAVLAMALFGPWMLRHVMLYASGLIKNIPGMF